MGNVTLYHQDFLKWTEQQVAYLRKGHWES